MFKFLKKKAQEAPKQTITSIRLEEVITSKYPTEVLQIHHEFDIASERLLIEANSIIKEAETKDVDKVERLEKLGFKQVAQVTQIKPLLEKAKLSKEQTELVAYYSFNYPNNKFITEEQVKTICHKYNLVCGDVSRFKGFVPEKNLKEIESFKLKENDSYVEIRNYGYKDEITFISKNEYEQSIKYGVSAYRRYSRSGLPLQICAPVKDMDISGLELVEGYKLQKKHIPDPVVLQPVKGGYLILTAWGDEASDELVVNQKFN